MKLQLLTILLFLSFPSFAGMKWDTLLIETDTVCLKLVDDAKTDKFSQDSTSKVESNKWFSENWRFISFFLATISSFVVLFFKSVADTRRILRSNRLTQVKEFSDTLTGYLYTIDIGSESQKFLTLINEGYISQEHKKLSIKLFLFLNVDNQDEKELKKEIQSISKSSTIKELKNKQDKIQRLGNRIIKKHFYH